MTQSTFISERIASLAEDAKSQQLDDETRAVALNAARDLVAALESPVERVIQDVVLVCQFLIVVLFFKSYVKIAEFSYPDGFAHGGTTRHLLANQPEPRKRSQLRCHF